MSILVRQGSKRRLAKTILGYFPEHDMYIEMFFGTGAIFFEKEIAKFNILNDLDNLVYSLWSIMRNKEKREELVEILRQTPYHQTVFNEMRKSSENTPIYNALRLLVLSNFSLLGAMDTMKFGFTNAKKLLIQKLVDFNSSLGDGAKRIEEAQFTSCDFRRVLKEISFRTDRDKDRAFIYADPPYLNTSNKYKTPKFKEQDFSDLVDILVSSGIRFAISEFDNPFVLEKCKDLNIIILGERQNLKNRRTEILITNYNIEENK